MGGEFCVTGSCHLVQASGVNLLVDCGSVQGGDESLPMDRWPLSPSELHFVLVTHAHIDHIGGIPELIRRGFRGEILATHPTKALLVPGIQKPARIKLVHGEADARKGLADTLRGLAYQVQ